MASILVFFRMIGWRNLLLVILAATVFFLVRSQFFPDNPAKPRVVSLFDRVEYVRELRLVTHYSEELLEIGVQDALGRKLQKQEEKLENGRLLLRQLKEKSTLANEYAGKAASTRSQLERRKRLLIKRRDSLVSSFRRVDPGRRISAREVERILSRDPRAFSQDLSKKVRMWSMLPNDQPEKRLFEKEIREMAAQESLERKEQHEVSLAEVERQLDQTREFLEMAENEAKRAEKDARHSGDEANEAYLQFRQDSVLYLELEAELRNQETDPLPKLLAVVSTEVTALVDLQGMESDLDGGTLTLCGVPPARVDSNVRIRLSSENRFLTARNLTLLVTNKSEDEIEMGVYYHVYEEMKEALAELESEVISEAIDRGILGEADDMGRQYLEQMGRSLGFSQVIVKESCSDQAQTPTTIIDRSDSILVLTDEIIRRSDSLDAFMQDSLGLEVDTVMIGE